MFSPFKIAGHLSPDDLLRLARTTKRIRDILMSKYSKHIWVAARKTLGVPDCPPDLSEPHYADLLFGLGQGCTVSFLSYFQILLANRRDHSLVLQGTSDAKGGILPSARPYV